jgi:hypothetical protein
MRRRGELRNREGIQPHLVPRTTRSTESLGGKARALWTRGGDGRRGLEEAVDQRHQSQSGTRLGQPGPGSCVELTFP